MQRKASGVCPRCGMTPAPASVLCELHRDEAARRVRVSSKRARNANRANGKCAFCGAQSESYRCLSCRERFNTLRKMRL